MRLLKPALKVSDQSVAAVIAMFMNPDRNPKWGLPPPNGYTEGTKDGWARELKLASRSDTLGALSVFAVTPHLVQSFLDGLAAKPAKQKSALSALRVLDKWAIRHALFPHSITYGCEAEGSDGGHIPWEESHVALAEQHARPDLARAITLAAGTGQRGSDLVKMRWTDIETVEGRPGINVVQKKTRKQLWVPFTGSLSAILATWERRPGFILRKMTGHHWSRRALSWEWSVERASNRDLEPLRLIGQAPDQRPAVMHGLRGTACVRLSRAGATTRQICDLVGMSDETVTRYLRFSVQKSNAIAAVLMLDRTAREQAMKKRDAG